MRTFTNEEIIERVESLPTFKGWKKGVYDVWIRSQADAYDLFDDKAFTFEVEKEGDKPKFVVARGGTTNSGSYGLKNFEDYNSKGTAVLKSDHMVYESHRYGNHPYRNGKPAYRQAKPWPYFRDNNKNNKAEETGREYNDVIGANIHRAGVNSTVIKNWSTACLVTSNLAKFQEFLNFMTSVGRPPLNVVILKEWPKSSSKVKKTVSSKPVIESTSNEEGTTTTVTTPSGTVVGVETKEGESESTNVASSQLATESTPTQEKVTIWQRFASWTEKLNILSGLRSSASGATSGISGGSRFTFLLTKMGGWGMLIAGFFYNHWTEILVGTALIIAAVWYLSHSKGRATQRDIAPLMSPTAAAQTAVEVKANESTK